MKAAAEDDGAAGQTAPQPTETGLGTSAFFFFVELHFIPVVAKRYPFLIVDCFYLAFYKDLCYKKAREGDMWDEEI